MEKSKQTTGDIIFNNILENKKTLIIRDINTISKIVKEKKNNLTVIQSNSTVDILLSLEKFQDYEFDYIILTLELTKLRALKELIPALAKKGNVLFLTVKNKSMFIKNVLTKKEELLRIFEKNNIKILKSYYTKDNKIYKNSFTKLFAYYITYIVYRDTNFSKRKSEIINIKK